MTTISGSFSRQGFSTSLPRTTWRHTLLCFTGSEVLAWQLWARSIRITRFSFLSSRSRRHRSVVTIAILQELQPLARLVQLEQRLTLAHARSIIGDPGLRRGSEI